MNENSAESGRGETELSPLVELRKKCAFSQAKLAELGKLAVHTLQKLESGETKSPRGDTARTLARLCAVELHEWIAIHTATVRWRRAKFAPKSTANGATGPVLTPNGDDRTKSEENASARGLAEDPSPYKTEFDADGVGGWERREDLSIYDRCEEIFLSLAYHNAQCDMAIFDTLYLERPLNRGAESLEEKRAYIKSAIFAINHNVGHVLNCTKELFDVVNDLESAVCLQVFRAGESERDGFVHTTARDAKSASRWSDDKPHSISNNTIGQKLFVEGQKYFKENDLAAAIARGDLRTDSRRAGSEYNAVYIRLVPSLPRPDSRSNISLCLDSLRPFRKDRDKINDRFASEVAWRVAVLCYRLERLEQELEALGKR